MNLFEVNLIILWLVSVILNYGILFAESQNSFSKSIADDFYYPDMVICGFLSIFLGIAVPIGSPILTWYISEKAKHGLKFI